MFPKVRDAMTRSELTALGNALQQARSVAYERPHPRSPDTPPANLAAAVNTPIDSARAAGEAVERKVSRLPVR